MITQLLILALLIGAAGTLIVALIGLNGRMFVQIPQNHVAGIFLFGRRLHYAVSCEEDLQKLCPPGSNNTGKVIVTTDIFGLKRAFNLGLYSWNPFATIQPVGVYKHHWKKPGEWTPESSVKEKITLAEESREKFLRIDSINLGVDEGVELKGNTQVNFTRQANIRVGDLDEIYLTQNGRFSSYVDETLKAGVMSVLNEMSFESTAGGTDGFQDADFSESSIWFNTKIKERIKGAFGATVGSIAITDWELAKASQDIVDAINRATIAGHNLEATKKEAEGKAALVTAAGLAEAEVTKAKLAAEAKGNKKVLVSLTPTTDNERAALEAFTTVRKYGSIPQLKTLVEGGGKTPVIINTEGGEK